MEARLLFVHAMSPLHAGTGQGVGVIDLPIAREKATGLPFVPGSTLKGILRDACPAGALRTKVFGPDTDNASLHAGSAQFADARLLLLPVRSLRGTFAWVTSPLILQRLLRDIEDAGVTDAPATVPAPADEGACTVAGQNPACAITTGNPARVYLEDLDLNADPRTSVDSWAAWLGQRVFPENPVWQGLLAARLCVVHDDVLSFLLETSTEVTARIKLLDDKKTVQKGGLWYEEALPAETVLSGIVAVTPVLATSQEVFALLSGFAGKTMQVGGKATIGRGLCRLYLER